MLQSSIMCPHHVMSACGNAKIYLVLGLQSHDGAHISTMRVAAVCECCEKSTCMTKFRKEARRAHVRTRFGSDTHALARADKIRNSSREQASNFFQAQQKQLEMPAQRTSNAAANKRRGKKRQSRTESMTANDLEGCSCIDSKQSLHPAKATATATATAPSQARKMNP